MDVHWKNKYIGSKAQAYEYMNLSCYSIIFNKFHVLIWLLKYNM